MKRNTRFIVFSLIAAIIVAGNSLQPAEGNGSGAPAGNTGSPADNKTCARLGCHPGTATLISDVITSDVPATGYVPGYTYTITASITDPSLTKYGFQISPQNNAGTLLGTMALLDANKTKFTSNTNKYITHKSAGTTWPGHTATWSFSWTAPIAGTGDVTFYGAFNFSNNNNNTSGDVIHTSTLTIPEAFGVGIDDICDSHEFSLYPNPASSEILLSYYLSNSTAVVISLYDLSGKRLAMLQQDIQQEGKQYASFSLSDFANGTYIIELRTGDKTITRKFVKI